MESTTKRTSTSRHVYWLLVVQFIVQFATFFYLYLCVAKLQHEVRDIAVTTTNGGRGCGFSPQPPQPIARRKRSSAMPATDDNAVAEVFRVSAMTAWFMCVYMRDRASPCTAQSLNYIHVIAEMHRVFRRDYYYFFFLRVQLSGHNYYFFFNYNTLVK